MYVLLLPLEACPVRMFIFLLGIGGTSGIRQGNLNGYALVTACVCCSGGGRCGTPACMSWMPWTGCGGGSAIARLRTARRRHRSRQASMRARS